jgi:hypothetical protein
LSISFCAEFALDRELAVKTFRVLHAPNSAKCAISTAIVRITKTLNGLAKNLAENCAAKVLKRFPAERVEIELHAGCGCRFVSWGCWGIVHESTSPTVAVTVLEK